MGMPALSTHHLQVRLLWRRLGRRGAAFALALALLAASALVLTLSRYAGVPPAPPSPSPSYGHRLPALVDITLVYGATEKGAGQSVTLSSSSTTTRNDPFPHTSTCYPCIIETDPQSNPSAWVVCSVLGWDAACLPLPPRIRGRIPQLAPPLGRRKLVPQFQIMCSP